MRMLCKLLLAIGLVAAFGCALAGTVLALAVPGLPCTDLNSLSVGPCVAGSTPTLAAGSLFDLTSDPGTVNLGVFVIPGDVVICEHPANCSLTNPAGWSDLLRFADAKGGSTATLFADAEGGVGLPLGFALSLNALSIVETQTGFGDDRDFTVYTAGTNVYNVHSDAALTPEPGEPSETPEPSTLALFAGGALILGARFWRLRTSVRT